MWSGPVKSEGLKLQRTKLKAVTGEQDTNRFEDHLHFQWGMGQVHYLPQNTLSKLLRHA